MAVLTVQRATTAGVVASTLVAASGGGDTFANDGRTELRVSNGSGSPITVTVPRIKACDQGFLHPTVVVVAAAAVNVRIGLFRVDEYNDGSGFVSVTYSGVTTLTIGAFSV